jgi:hypothetical protein
MHGLINRSMQCFLRDSYGTSVWSRTAALAGCGVEGYESLVTYDDAATERLIAAAMRVMDRPRDALLEDLGTYLVSHPNAQSLRRLLRFGGVGFVDFLHSVEDLPARCRMAVPDLILPEMELQDLGDGGFRLHVQPMLPGFGHVVVGLLRAMADDYGALAMLDHSGPDPDQPGGERVSILLLDQGFAEGRQFDLAVAT